ncbi:MAG: protein translocase subunit SecD [Rhodobacterales bacterium]|nr:protein translocase subunit SecD [Rhodobacterales bacterium]
MTWIRVSGIAALLLGSIYVLLPTVLQDDLESRLAETTSAVDTTSGPKTDFDVDFTVATGDPGAISRQLERRLKAAGENVERVTADKGVKVLLGSTADRDHVIALSQIPGVIKLYSSADVPSADLSAETSALTPAIQAAIAGAGLDPVEWQSRLPAVQGEAMPIEAVALEQSVHNIEISEDGLVTGGLEGGIDEADGFLVLTVDNVVSALVITNETGVTLMPIVDNADLPGLLVSGALGGVLVQIAEEVVDDAAVVQEEPKEAPAPSMAPDWLLGMLPDTKINLGLDLQGGVDLTLQVGLEEAVLGQVNRDITFLKSQAVDEGVVFTRVRRDRTMPVVWIESELDLGAIQTFNRKALADYIYYSTDANAHGFEMKDQRVQEVQAQAVDQVLETLRKRVDATGVKEPSIVRKGGGRINVQLPGEVDLQAAIDAIGTTAVLEFRMVDEKFDPSVLNQIIGTAHEAMSVGAFLDDDLLNQWLWDSKNLNEDRIVLWDYIQNEAGEDVRDRNYALMNEVVLTGNDVNSAKVAWDQQQFPYVALGFKPRGGTIFCDITTANVGKRFGIVLDNEVQSTPSIREAICGGQASIDMAGGVDPLKDAETLSLVLRTGSLDAPVEVGSVSTIGASLGRDSIRKGSSAALVGGGIVLVFMVVWYGSSGIIADIALMLNVLMVMASLALFGATLTLPGIAGIALTVGMAVDANIIIYERIREELALGVHARKAVDVGFEKAVVAVLDANITTAIAGVVLYSYGTGPIKGFAVTLLIGIMTTLITALFVTRTLMELSTRNSNARLRL